MSNANQNKRQLPRSRNELRVVEKVFIHSVMFELGILPIEDPVLDMRVALKQLSPEEARILKRKFRKLWRKCMKLQTGPSDGKLSEKRMQHAKSKLGVGKHIPNRAERLARKRLVFEKIWAEAIVPMLEKFENPSDTPTQEP